jgi:propanol-preferring alcohol dehydrogenase
MGDLPVRRAGVVPGHEAVGNVVALGEGTSRLPVGARVGVPWLRHTCGTCRFCTTGHENLCRAPRFTGWDDDGGYAEYLTVPEAYAYEIPPAFDDVRAAPLLCAGIIGFRALERARVPEGGRLGIFGFGGSAHLAAQIALHRGADVSVYTRAGTARRLALDLGCSTAGDLDEVEAGSLDAAIVFAPSGEIVPVALEALDRGGRLAVAGIHLSDVPPLDYQRHLFHERELVSVTANTRDDGRRFLAEAADARIRVETTEYPFSRADRALDDLWSDRVRGAAVLVMSEGD